MSVNCDFRVNFLIVGAMKSGTTALASFLRQHPEICMSPKKEIHFFDAEGYDDSLSSEAAKQQYRSHFPNYAGERIVGEATPIYMYFPPAARRIYRYNPEMKIIFLLRDPVQRAISHYYHTVRTGNGKGGGKEWLPLKLALAVEKLRLWRDKNDYSLNSSIRLNSYGDRGLYVKQIMRMLEFFSRQQMLFIKTEDLLTDHSRTLNSVYEFLGVRDRRFIPEQTINSFEGKVYLSKHFINRFKKRYIDEIKNLEKLLGFALSDWK
jgi:hypothetical protein